MTFSIIACDPNTKEYGMAICSAVPFIGKYSAYIFPEKCVISAQGKIDPCTAYTVRNLLLEGLKGNEILNFLKEKDPSYERKQLGFLNLKNWSFVGYTGEFLKKSKNEYAETYGEILFNKNFMVLGNCLMDLDTLYTMQEAYLKNIDLPLDIRILEALKAGDQTQADFRGRQSASLCLYRQGVEYPIKTIDVDEHKEPVQELERIFIYAHEHWQCVVDHCFFDMNFKRVYQNISDFPTHLVEKINNTGKPLNKR